MNRFKSLLGRASEVAATAKGLTTDTATSGLSTFRRCYDGQEMLLRQDFPAAEQEFDGARRVFEEKPARFKLSWQAACKVAAKRDPQLADAMCEFGPWKIYLGLGSAVLGQGRHAEAAEILDQAVARSAPDIRASYLAGLAHLKADNRSEARRHLLAATAVDSKYRDAPHLLEVASRSKLNEYINFADRISGVLGNFVGTAGRAFVG